MLRPVLSIFGAIALTASYATGALATDTLRVGDRAPDFTLPLATKDTIMMTGATLSASLKQGAVILAFYPADWSGGCAREMCAFRDSFTGLAELGVTVFGISGDYVFSHREWARSLNLPFALLSDHDHAVARAYQSYNEAKGYNVRTVFVVGQDGQVLYADRAYSTATSESFDRLRRFLDSQRTSTPSRENPR